MPSYPRFTSPTSSPPHGLRDHSPSKPSPLRHTLSTRSANSDTDEPHRYSKLGTNGPFASYDSPNVPSVTRPTVRAAGHKRERSESPVKKSAAFAKWEQRELAVQESPSQSHSPSRSTSTRAPTMDISPKKMQDDDWRSSLGRSETRPALRPVASNVLPDAMTDVSRLSSEVKGAGPRTRDQHGLNTPAQRSADPSSWTPTHTRGRSGGPSMPSYSPEPVSSPSAPLSSARNSMATLSRSDSMRASTRPRQNGHARFSSTDNAMPQLDGDDLASLQKSSTPQLQHLSKIATEEGSGEFGIHSPDEQVVGLAGRRRLQRSGTVRQDAKKQLAFASQYSSTKWMETQRKHLQAYEYLCHIGEARAWLEDVLEPVELAPIVQLEEALRDGVTLAEAVVRLAPLLPQEQQRNIGSQRIFRSAKLQYRHSDNIALFFRFLAQVELPELFRFELVDLYEKKNIPKVIYCIHALSWLLYRKGIVHFRIGNLVGQLQFEEHELEETQKGIDRSGVQMPNFGGMREAMQIEEPEPEPEPTPEELLAEQTENIVDMQSQIRGALVRLQLGDVMQQLWDAEEQVAQLQAIARGGFAREVFDFKFAMDLSTRRFQHAAQGYLLRRHLRQRQRAWVANESAVVMVQALWRGRQERLQTRHIQNQLQRHERGLNELQAAIRGALGRWRAGDIWSAAADAETEITTFQAQARAALQRIRMSKQQAAARNAATGITRLQAVARGLLHRKEQNHRSAQFEVHVEGLSRLQAVARARLSRRNHEELLENLSRHDSVAKSLQALSRAMLQRKAVGAQLGALEKHETAIITLQSLARAYMERQRIYDQLVAMEKHESSIIQLQALARAMMLRSHVGDVLAELDQCETEIARFQAACRGSTVRVAFEDKRRHFNDNMQKVIKLQSFVRAKQQGESYKSLVSGKNPPLPVVRRHLHLLTDSTLEFESELEAERLRRQVVESVRRNELVEGYVEGLDVKIALLVKNKITLDEVVKHQKHFGGSASQLLRNGTTVGQNAGGFDLKALNKSSRKKLASYEELFFMLQTQPAYLARLLQQMTVRGLADNESKNLDRLVMVLFGYAQKSREERCLVKVLTSGVQQTVRQSQSLDEFARLQNNGLYQRLLLSFLRGPKDRAYLKTLLGGMIKTGICAQDHLDLESDPLQIYRAILNNEELSTGRPSTRDRDLPREVVIREPDVRPRYVEHLQELRDLCDAFFVSLEETMHRMPSGIRCVAAAQYRSLCEHFPRDDPAYLAILAGNWLWKSYLLPALKEPEMWGVVDRGLAPAHRRNLAQVITVLGQVALGRLFAGENLYLQPLNNWVSESLERWQECLAQLFDTQSIEENLEADQFSDLYAKNKPTLYIKLADIFAVHGMLSDNLSAVAPTRDDPIRVVLSDLGTPKGNESDLASAAKGGEITLTLKSRFKVQEDPDAEARALFTATKRYVLYMIKVQSGTNLMEILLRPISHEDADRWIQLVQEEAAEKDHNDGRRPRRRNSHFDPHGSLRGAKTMSVYSEATSNASEDRRELFDLQSMTYAELKSSALENILALESPSTPPQFRVSRHNNYQELLNALAADIRQKHRRRLERQHELESTRATLAQLDSKAEFLEEQLKSYNDYIEQSLHTLASKKGGGRHRFLLPFTKQWTHERELHRAGRQPRFGSYKYSARQLADKGVLLSWPAFTPDQWGQLDLVIASDDPGVFHVEASSGSMMLPGASANLLLDDLLQAQYDGQQAIAVFEEMSSAGGAKLAVNLLLHLLFKKFYRDE